ncbi:MAG: IS5/IS1182 family transposase, partial [Paracoccus sp. (in: a-proteobacteria)]
MSKPALPRYRTTHWPKYNRALERRGAMLILIDPKMDWLAGLDWPVPDYTTLCRRQKTLAVQ